MTAEAERCLVELASPSLLSPLLEPQPWAGPGAFSLGLGGLPPEALAHSPPSHLQLQYMMVMVGYPDFLLKPEAVDKEYEVGLPSAPVLPSLAGQTSPGPWPRPPWRPSTIAEKEPQPHH